MFKLIKQVLTNYIENEKSIIRFRSVFKPDKNKVKVYISPKHLNMLTELLIYGIDDSKKLKSILKRFIK